MYVYSFSGNDYSSDGSSTTATDEMNRDYTIWQQKKTPCTYTPISVTVWAPTRGQLGASLSMYSDTSANEDNSFRNHIR